MKIRLLAGIAAGYVLGTRAGRERYDRMVQTLNDSELVQQARDELAKRRGTGQSSAPSDATGAPGLVAPPVIVGPGPQATGTSSKSSRAGGDVVVPDLEPSTSAQDSGAAGEAQPARRIDPPAPS